MNKEGYDKFLKHYRRVNELADKELRKLSFKDKLKQITSLLLFASQIKISFRRNKHLFTNWTLLKSRI